MPLACLGQVFDDENFFAKKARGSEEEAQRLLQRAVSSIQWTDLECSKAFQRVQELAGNLKAA